MVKASIAQQPAILAAAPVRTFGITKYAFDDEDWKPNQFQVSRLVVEGRMQIPDFAVFPSLSLYMYV